ncbi:DnaJ domain [Rubrobacter radiotolerans]|uniref:DnaJ domain n=1 Tax=Rubrobacter radiotolerans TaxID=42256 RepID=A0A023WYR9_RUBRA|nr:J domain-containing protein [Rubrobacter radiotolerans]AHY45377.1 DnaJ domain [Rubrobacter radiotolerans]MDX5892788.1 J domain-containing protein [Rubrobacter radiotolerans]SMC02498.1 heat shock protein DnaJ domain protein [Rubrobacter radiotolerans DSM 5868]
MSIPRRLGRFARGFVSGVSGGSSGLDGRSRPGLEDYLRTSRQRGENLRDALNVAWRSAAEEWRRAEEARIKAEREREQTLGRGSFEEDRRSGLGDRMRERVREVYEEAYREANRRAGQQRTGGRNAGDFASTFAGPKYSPEVLRAYERLDLMPGTSPVEVDRRRRELIKKFHPDRFTDPDKRVRAERVTAEINAAHDLILRRRAGRRF